jgi:hypothetical protein
MTPAAAVLAQRGDRPFFGGPPPAADNERLAAELRVAQQLDRRIERVHVEVGDEAGSHGH